MQLVYKIFLGIFSLCIGASLYAFNWELGFMNEENATMVFSLSAGIIGIILVFILNTWSKLALKKS